MMDVQETLIGGGSASDALLKEFGKEGIKAVADAVDIDLPDVDFDTPEILEKVGDAVVDLAKPVLEKVEDVAKPVVDAIQEVTEPVIEFVEEKAPELSFEQLKARERSERRAKVAKPGIRRP